MSSSAPARGIRGTSSVGNVVTKVEINDSLYRLALKASGISVMDYPLDQEPETLSPELKDLLSPIACIPLSWAQEFPALQNLDVFYADESIPEYFHPQQQQAIQYAFYERHIEICNENLQGKTESEWREVTVGRFVAKMLNPTREFTELNNVLMKYPVDLDNPKALTQPKPDWILGLTIDIPDDELLAACYIPNRPTKHLIPMNAVSKIFTTSREYEEFTCSVGHFFAAPLLVLERKSMAGGTLFSCQNQLFGGLRTTIAAMRLTESKLKKGLNTVAIGLCNVGNYVEVWAMIQLDIAGRCIARYLEGYNLLKRNDLASFCCLLMRLYHRNCDYFSSLQSALASIPILSHIGRPATPSNQSRQSGFDDKSPAKSKGTRRTRLSLGGKPGTPDFSGTRNPDEMQEEGSVLTDLDESESRTQKRSESLIDTQHWISTEMPTAPTITSKLPILDISVYASAVGGTIELVQEELDAETDEGVLV